MAPTGKRFFNKRYIATAGSERAWGPAKISTRINSNGGHHQDKINKDTTHLVVTARMWKAQGNLVKEALAINDDIDNNRKTKQKQKISIVSFDWLDDSWRSEKAKLEEPYKWEKIDPKPLKKGQNAEEEESSDEEDSDSESDQAQKKKPAGKAAGKANANANGKKAKQNDGPKNAQGMMAEVFQESTDKYVSAKEVAAIQKRQENERRVREELADEEAKEKEKEKAAAAFKKRAKKCRNEIFSKNHHVYTDETGFKYDVLLTKVDTRRNKNERWALTLQIYESNSEPYTYAMNAQFGGTGTRSANNVIAALGSSIYVAFHAFKVAFKEKTGVDWDNRISFHLERNKREKLNRGQGTGSDHGTQRGVPVSENGAAKAVAASEEDFLTAPFLYHPPQYGARGILSDSEKKKLEREWPGMLEQTSSIGSEKGKEKVTDHEKINQWINHTTGADPHPPNDVDVPMIDVEDPEGRTQIDVDIDKIFGGPLANAQLHDFDFDHPYEWPFDGGDEVLEPAAQTDQNDTSFEDSFNHLPTVADSFEVGTQQIGETQLAEKAGSELMEHLDIPTDQQLDSVDVPMKPADNDDNEAMEGVDQPADSGNATISAHPKLDFGSSILSKRKDSAIQEGPAAKKARPAEIPGSFAEEVEVLDTPDACAEERMPASFMEELLEEADPANAQLLQEMAGPEGEKND